MEWPLWKGPDARWPPLWKGRPGPALERGSPVVRSRLLSEGRPARDHGVESANDDSTLTWWGVAVPESTPMAMIPVSIPLFPKGRP
jgi:hypothetical protein